MQPSKNTIFDLLEKRTYKNNLDYHISSLLRNDTTEWNKFNEKIKFIYDCVNRSKDNISIEAMHQFIRYYEANYLDIRKKKVQDFIVINVELNNMITILKIRKPSVLF